VLIQTATKFSSALFSHSALTAMHILHISKLHIFGVSLSGPQLKTRNGQKLKSRFHTKTTDETRPPFCRWQV